MDKLLESTINRYQQIKKNKYYKLLKNLTSVTHIRGMYLNFYMSPFDLMKKDKATYIFHKKIDLNPAEIHLCEGQKIQYFRAEKSY